MQTGPASINKTIEQQKLLQGFIHLYLSPKNVKSNVHHITYHEGKLGEWQCSFTASLTLALYGEAIGYFTPGKTGGRL